jgi:hypothetical protein
LSPQGRGELAKGQEASGGQVAFFFDYFLLATQKKVTRLSVRPIGRIADWHLPFRAKNRDVFRETDIKISLAKRILIYKQLRFTQCRCVA